MIILRILLWIFIALLCVRILLGIIRKFVHFPAPVFSNILLDLKLRKLIQPPALIIKNSGVKEGMQILEIGSGSGFFTLPFAIAVGNEGGIVALDIQQNMNNKLNKKLAKGKNKDIKNIRIVNASAYEIPYPADAFDVVFMVSVLEKIPDPHEALLEAYRVLKKGGIMSISGFIPDPDWSLPSKIRNQLADAGFKYINIYGNILRYTCTGVK